MSWTRRTRTRRSARSTFVRANSANTPPHCCLHASQSPDGRARSISPNRGSCCGNRLDTAPLAPRESGVADGAQVVLRCLFAAEGRDALAGLLDLLAKRVHRHAFLQL